VRELVTPRDGTGHWPFTWIVSMSPRESSDTEMSVLTSVPMPWQSARASHEV
jgi:hypothetical protein